MEQEIHFCTTADGVRIAYATVGQGPPLVKAANWLNHLEFDWRSPVWHHLLKEFARNHLFVRYDERGNGLSDWAVKEFSFESFVRDLESVVDAVGLSRFSLLGISQGGAVAIAYAVRHPERVSHLILYGTFAVGWAKRGASPEAIEQREAQLTLIKLGWGKDNPAFRQLWTTLYMPDATPEQMQWFNDLQRITTSPENAARLFSEVGNIDVDDLLPQVKVPTLVLHCRSDAMVPFEAGRRIAALIPGARFVPLEGRNHLLLEGEPAWAKFIIEVRRFLGTDEEATTPKQEGLRVAVKRCPTCQRIYADETLRFCRHDGTSLVRESSNPSERTPAFADHVEQSSEFEPTRPFHPDTASNEDSSRELARALRPVRASGRYLDVEEATTRISPAPISSRVRQQDIRYCAAADGVHLAYSLIGTGPLLVRVLGHFTHLEMEWEWPDLRHFWERLAERYTVVRYDGRGMGLSDRYTGEFTEDTRQLDLDAVLIAVGAENAILLGISEGGWTAVTYAIHHSEHISHLILYGAYCRGAQARPSYDAEEDQAIVTLIRKGWGRDTPAFRQVFTSQFFRPDADPKLIAHFNEMQRASADPETAARYYQSLHTRGDGRDLFRQVSVPTLVVHSSDDMAVSAEEGRLLASLIPGAHLVLLPSGTHYFPTDREVVMKVVEAINRFVGQQS